MVFTFKALKATAGAAVGESPTTVATVGGTASNQTQLCTGANLCVCFTVSSKNVVNRGVDNNSFQIETAAAAAAFT